LQESKHTDLITQVFKITAPTSEGGTGLRVDKKIGYTYITEQDFKFSTQEKNIGLSEIHVTSSPIFNTVKSVVLKNKQVAISSGFNGISKVILIVCNFTIIISIIYLNSIKKITENARLNLVFLNFFMFLLWLFIIFKFGI